MAMLGDGTQSYNNDKDGSDKELAGCEVIYIKKIDAKFETRDNNVCQSLG